MRKLHKIILSILVLALIVSLSGCKKKTVEPTEPSTTEEITTEAPTEEVATEAPTEEPTEEETEPAIVQVATLEEIQERLQSAIAKAVQPSAFEVSALAAPDDWQIAVKNMYFAITGEHPEYKYAYDVVAKMEDDGLLHCEVSYMPYRLGKFPEGFKGTSVWGIKDLMYMAEENLDKESVRIRITNPKLLVDDMNHALGQVGGSYLLCQLNKDATEIIITPQNDMTQKEALARLAEIDKLADEIYAECVTPDMTDLEAAEALYTYLTDKVAYDMRYYNDKENMPYASMTAYGALHDNMAICGGYAQALQVLFRKAGITSLTVSGVWGSENHMWNVAYVDGNWRYFDATSDRGRSGHGFKVFNVTPEEMPNYTWDKELITRLTDDIVSGWGK